MKLTKSDVTLNERDSLQDILESEKQLMGLYATALFEGSTKAVRKNFSTNLMGVAETDFKRQPAAHFCAAGFYRKIFVCFCGDG